MANEALKVENYITKVQAPARRGDKELTTFGFIDARGRDVIKAQQLMDGDASRYFPCLMHVVCRVNDKREAIEYYENLPMGTFNQLMVALNEEGFTA